ncbi:NACHT domain-containing protein [Vibrio parahaemolyticus]|nr:NACHT domain-containing protein [Vibrio parahaemolyticus]MDF5599744.1 NACHT domain-containing protein [Vibrio parahaemolyticus]MDG2583570.1 NACHT domain-containing protein [Vibrio parahaemolyticus]MDG2818327.1 NACHT domain-containing protein [Vibrio parahaemolyticus]
MDQYPSDIFDLSRKVLICDSAGMGKSTLLKMIYRYAIDDIAQIPFYIDLKSLIHNEKVESVEDHLLRTFPSFNETPSKGLFTQLLEHNKYLFLFDGADEVADKYKEEVFRSVNVFSDKAKSSSIVVATREEDLILSSFYDFRLFKIKNLTKDCAFALLRKYEFKDCVAENLIDEIENNANKTIEEFLKNPLLTTLLYTAYSYSRQVPLKKSLFYKQVYHALYENHDATKQGFLTREKKSGLDIDDFESIVSSLAYASRFNEELEYKRDKLKHLIDEIANRQTTITFDKMGFLSDITASVPLLKKDGLHYRWQHKSIQEYFFVRHMLLSKKDDRKKEILNKMLLSRNSNRFLLSFDILYDEDEDLFHDVCTRALVKYARNSLANSTTIYETDEEASYKMFNISYASPEIRNDLKNIKGNSLINIAEKYSKILKVEGFRVKFLTSSKIQLERPETVILKVLQSKKSELVTTVNTREFESDYIFDDVPILNIAKAIEFLKTFDEKMKANDEEEFSDFGFL